MRFDSGRRLVVCDGGGRVHLTPKAFDLLQVLIEEAPRVVRKAELHARLWPDSFVSDATLAGLVKELRRAFRAGQAARSFIRTSHGVGYAFDGPLAWTSESPCAACWVVFRERPIRLKAGENIIGRDRLSDVCLDAAGVSRRHARIVVGAAGAFLEDLGSKNGTALLDGPVTAPVPLGDGAIVRVGPVSIVYRAMASFDEETTVCNRDWHGDIKNAANSAS